MPLAAFMPVAQEFEKVTVAFGGIEPVTVEVIRDCFQDFRIAVQTTQVVAATVSGTTMDACVLRLDTADYAWITQQLVTMAALHCGGRIVSVLEGGYDLAALAAAAAAHVRGLMRA